jgi:peptidoglycan hydrolase CwlO-like protein
MNNKFSIGVVIAIVLQVSAFVWWTAQQAQTINQLNEQVSELTSRMAVEQEVNLQRDVSDLKDQYRDLKEKTLDGILEIDKVRLTEDNRLGEYIDRRLAELIGELQSTFAQHESWIDEIDDDIAKLDKKLSDRIRVIKEKQRGE